MKNRQKVEINSLEEINKLQLKLESKKPFEKAKPKSLSEEELAFANSSLLALSKMFESRQKPGELRSDYLRRITPDILINGDAEKSIKSTVKVSSKKSDKDVFINQHSLDCKVSTFRAYFYTNNISNADAEDAIKLYIKEKAEIKFNNGKYKFPKRTSDTFEYRKVFTANI